MDEPQFTQHIQDKARHIANYLNTSTPYERALILAEADTVWEERRQQVPESVQAAQAEEDLLIYATQWIGQRLRQMSPEARIELIEFVRTLDEDGRWERLAES